MTVLFLSLAVNVFTLIFLQIMGEGGGEQRAWHGHIFARCFTKIVDKFLNCSHPARVGCRTYPPASLVHVIMPVGKIENPT